MSWGFFNKRKPTRLNVDRDLERHASKCSQLEVNAKKLYKDMKRYNESLSELTKTELKIAQDITSTSFNRQKEGKTYAEELAAALQNLEQYRHNLTTNVTKATIEPMKKFGSVFPTVNNGLKKREQCLQEYTRLQGKVEKYKDRERNPQNLSKLEQYEEDLDTAREDYQTQNAVMLDELPRLWEGRITYFEPCFKALEKSQVDYYSKCCQAYGELVEKLESATHSRQSDVHEMLDEFRSLSIVGNVEGT